MSPIVLFCALAISPAAPPVTKTTPAPPASNEPQRVREFLAAPKDKQGRITLSLPIEHVSLNDDEVPGKTGCLELTGPQEQVSTEDVAKFPEKLDRVEIRLSSEVVTQLRKIGITDFAAHFQGRTIQATGKPICAIYFGFPAVVICSVLVERIEDFEIVAKDKKG